MTDMGRLEFATPQEAWGGEAESFTPKISKADLLEYLGQETGIGPMTLIEAEHSTAGGRALDILAETADGTRVAIENQYRTADHDHLTRGLAYAVATESRALVVIAEDHRDEFVAVANYLNEVGGTTDQGISVWLVKVRAVRRIGDEIWSPEFVVQAEPNEWAAEIRSATGGTLPSLEHFYERCAAETDMEWAGTARTIIEEWLERPGGNEDHKTKTHVGLYLRSPSNQARGTNVLQLDLSGRLIISRGYIWASSGAFDPDREPTELDQQINAHFPNAHWPPKKAFISEHNASPETVRRFGDWLEGQFGIST